MSDQRRAEEAVVNRVSTFDEKWIRLAMKVEFKVVIWSETAPPWSHYAYVELRCPKCATTRYVECHGNSAREAADGVVTKVAAHGLACDGFLGEPEDYE